MSQAIRNPNAFMIGAGVGPAYLIGVNSEVGHYVNYIFSQVMTNPVVAVYANMWIKGQD